MDSAVIFGGTGFIGTFFAQHLIEEHSYEKVYLFDIETLSEKGVDFRIRSISEFPQIEVIQGDVTKRIDWFPAEKVDLVANFAAIHREPGHQNSEYFLCNIKGAENVCDWMDAINCNRLIFTSSIAPYGPSEAYKDEYSIPSPETAYGSSKLVAEKIHQIWKEKDPERQLVIVRPGVVFGPGEGGNVSRLIKAVLHRYFFYMANANTRKAGIYVKELCHAIMWVLESERAKRDRFTLFNMTMNPGPSISEYVNAICRVAELNRFVPAMPRSILLALSYVIEAIAKPIGLNHPFSPVRVKKLIRSNNILPEYLVSEGYTFKYTLESALDDWKQNCPEEWR